MESVTGCLTWCISIHSLRMEGDRNHTDQHGNDNGFQSTPSAWRETKQRYDLEIADRFQSTPSAWRETKRAERLLAGLIFQSTPSAWRETGDAARHQRLHFISIHSLRMEGDGFCKHNRRQCVISIHSLRMEGDYRSSHHRVDRCISIHSLRMEGDSKTAQESVFHFAYPCTILQKRMQKTTFCTRKNGFFRKKGEKFGAKPSASFCAPMIRTDTFPLNFSHRISGSSMSMVSFAPICSTFD